MLLLPPANEVCEGYVFTGVCLSTGGCLHHCMLGYTPPRDQRQTPPRQTPPGRHPPHSACWDTVNKRAVRIPLECILVLDETKQSFSFHQCSMFSSISYLLHFVEADRTKITHSQVHFSFGETSILILILFVEKIQIGRVRTFTVTIILEVITFCKLGVCSFCSLLCLNCFSHSITGSVHTISVRNSQNLPKRTQPKTL